MHNMEASLIESNIYNPEIEKPIPTVCVDIPLSRSHHFENYNSPDYNLALDVSMALVTTYYAKYEDDQIEETLKKVNINKAPGEYTGDLERDSMLLAIYALHHPEEFAYRWFRNDGNEGISTKVVLKDFNNIIENLDKYGTEMGITDAEPTYLSSDSALFWQQLGWPIPNLTTESYLLIFPAEGLTRRAGTNKDTYEPEFDVDFSTNFDKSTPALNERLKALIRMKWED